MKAGFLQRTSAYAAIRLKFGQSSEVKSQSRRKASEIPARDAAWPEVDTGCASSSCATRLGLIFDCSGILLVVVERQFVGNSRRDSASRAWSLPGAPRASFQKSTAGRRALVVSLVWRIESIKGPLLAGTSHPGVLRYDDGY